MIHSLSRVLLLGLLGAPVAAQYGHCPGGSEGTGCPDVKACQAAGSSTPAAGATSTTCGFGLVVFGVGGGLIGSTCWSAVVETPAHQVCCGAPNEDTRCVPEGTLPVTKKECSCGGLVIPGIATGIPITCSCGASSPFGTVEDFKTELCPGE